MVGVGVVMFSRAFSNNSHGILTYYNTRSTVTFSMPVVRHCDGSTLNSQILKTTTPNSVYDFWVWIYFGAEHGKYSTVYIYSTIIVKWIYSIFSLTTQRILKKNLFLPVSFFFLIIHEWNNQTNLLFKSSQSKIALSLFFSNSFFFFVICFT